MCTCERTQKPGGSKTDPTAFLSCRRGSSVRQSPRIVLHAARAGSRSERGRGSSMRQSPRNVLRAARADSRSERGRGSSVRQSPRNVLRAARRGWTFATRMNYKTFPEEMFIRFIRPTKPSLESLSGQSLSGRTSKFIRMKFIRMNVYPDERLRFIRLSG